MPTRDRSEAAAFDVTDLRVEYETEPTNVRPENPRFSWRATAPNRGAEQTAYRVLVARSPEILREGRGDLWDSGKVESSTSTDVSYDGIPLSGDERYYWTVRVWDERGNSARGKVETFATALAGDHAWDGRWIGYRPGVGDSNGYRSRWRSSEDAEEWVQVDLGASRSIDAIELHPTDPIDGPETPDGTVVSPMFSAEDERMPDGAGGFGFPTRYRIEVADDPSFDDGRTIVDRTESDQENPGTDPVTFEDVETSGRFVRLVATDLYEVDPANPSRPRPQVRAERLREDRQPWRALALAALAVRDDDGTDVAVDRSVSASSSVEAETWGRDHLVNGHYESRTGPGSAQLRTEVDLSKPVAEARLHVCALGYGDVFVNGEKAGDAVLDPGWTQYDERSLYRTFDVADRLTEGANALGVWLGRGWFSKNVRDWTGFGSPRALVQLAIEYEDGTTRTISSDGSWRATRGPVVANDIWDGETYDARLEQSGWAAPGLDTDDWEQATVVEGPGGRVVPQRTPPIRVTEEIDPVEVLDREDGPIVDFGENLVGWVELTVDGADAGDEITIQHAETLLDDGSLALEDLRDADATDTYIAKGDGSETYEPRFTYHGFRYAQIRGYPGDVSLDDVRAKRVHTDLEPIGDFDCSNEDLVRLQRNAERGLRGNLHSVITDCPQRDERFGWTGDNHIVARSVLCNFDAALFYEKWLDDHADIRSEHGYIADTIPYGYGTIPEDPTWGITQVTVPWHLYQQRGDVGALERHYEGMRRYVDYWYSVSEDGIIPAEYANYGDWLAFENADGNRGRPFELFTTAFQYHTTNLFAKIARVLDNEADAERYAARATAMRDAFNDAFFDPETAQYRSGTQASYAVPLYLGLVPDEHVDAVAANLAEKVRSDGGKLQTGFLGTRPLIHTLVDHGYEEVAYEVVSQPERPGWVYMVRQGATTMWERWDSDDRIGDGMNSFNHSPFNFVSEWFYDALAGIRVDRTSPGTGSVEIAPTVVDDLSWAEATMETGDGTLTSRWERTEDGLTLAVEVPWNTTATVRVPSIADEVRVTESGDPVWDEDGTPADALPDGIEAVRADDGVALDVGAGSYQFEIREP